MSWIEDVNFEISKLDFSIKSLRKFGITIGIILIAISIWLFLSNSNILLIIIISIFSIILLILGLFSPKRLNGIYKYWMKIAFILGWFVSRFILTILFILVLTPIALLAKLFKKDFLNLRNIDNSTYWKKKDGNTGNYEKMY